MILIVLAFNLQPLILLCSNVRDAESHLWFKFAVEQCYLSKTDVDPSEAIRHVEDMLLTTFFCYEFIDRK